MSAKKKHILIITSEFPPLPGGIGNHAYNLAKYLDINGYPVKVIADQRSSNKSEESSFDHQLTFSVQRVALRKIRLIMYVNRLKLLFSSAKTADVIIATGKFSLWSVALISHIRKKNYMAIVHGTEVNFSNKLLRRSINWALKRFSTVVAVSHYTKSLIDHLQLNRVVVIPNGVSMEESSNYKMDKLQELKGNPALLTVGNVTERKGQLNVIKHLSDLKKVYPDLHYHCVGFPTEKERCLKAAEAMGVNQDLTFHGHVSHDELNTFYQNSDLFIMLSTQTATGDVEGFGIAILEANWFGLPAIGSLDSGIEDAINHNQTGLLVNPIHTEDFVEAVTHILEDKEHFSANAQQWAQRHRWEIVIKSYINSIESL